MMKRGSKLGTRNYKVLYLSKATCLFLLFLIGIIFTACGESVTQPVPSELNSPTASTTVPASEASTTSSSVETGLAEGTVQPAVKIAVGGTAPDFTWLNLEGQSFQLSKVLSSGKAVVINFWSVYCQPCREEAPQLVKAAEANKAKIAFVGINMNDTVEEAKAFSNEFKVTYPTLLDNTGDLVWKFRIRGRPTTFFINKQGVFSGITLGQLTPQSLEQELTKILN